MSTLSELYITMENLRKPNLPIDERLKQEAAKDIRQRLAPDDMLRHRNQMQPKPHHC